MNKRSKAGRWTDLLVQELPVQHRDSLDLSIHFSRRPTPEQAKRIDDLLYAWYVVGVSGGYGDAGFGNGVMHNMHPGEWVIDDEDPHHSLTVDLGSASDEALTVLFRSLNHLISNGIPIEHVTVGVEA